MAKRIFKSDLSVKGIENLKNQLLNYRDNLVKQKLDELVRELAQVGILVIESNMSQANYTYDSSNIQSGADTSHNTYVKTHSFGNYAEAKLIVEGRELLFIEFGAGVYYNATVGATDHPKGDEFGFLIGTYGQGMGARQVWGYYNDSGDLVLTHGVQATMPVYKAGQAIIKQVVNVAKKVFGR